MKQIVVYTLGPISRLMAGEDSVSPTNPDQALPFLLKSGWTVQGCYPVEALGAKKEWACAYFLLSK